NSPARADNNTGFMSVTDVPYLPAWMADEEREKMVEHSNLGTLPSPFYATLSSQPPDVNAMINVITNNFEYPDPVISQLSSRYDPPSLDGRPSSISPTSAVVTCPENNQNISYSHSPDLPPSDYLSDLYQQCTSQQLQQPSHNSMGMNTVHINNDNSVDYFESPLVSWSLYYKSPQTDSNSLIQVTKPSKSEMNLVVWSENISKPTTY
ncbi:hypothetical protein RBB50_012905, partial [Rhinocladiella similis]